jgi:4-amino-4-deoxy-L-arabinose transferase-like glycosyltransferase
VSGSDPERITPPAPGAAASAAFLAALGLCTFALLALRMPIASEIRYIESSREMVASGDWIVPHLGYVPYFEKPILLYWLGAASQLVCGGSVVAARLPSILGATLSLLVTWEMARGLLGERGGMQAALLLLGSAYFLVLGSVLTTDTLFAACLWSAWYAWWRARGERGSRWKWAYCVATALGFMTKGPLALILVGGSIATFQVLREPWPAEQRSRPRALALRVLRGLRAALSAGHVPRLVLVTIALNLPWTIAVLRRDPRLLEFFYVRENFKAFFDGSVHHTQNAFYYVGVLLVAFAPWSIACFAGIAVALRERVVAAWSGPPRGEKQELRAYLGAIALFTLAFLQASSAKLASYPLPILPALAILVVDVWQARLARPPAWLRWSLLAGALLTIACVGVYLTGRTEDAATVPAELRQHLGAALALTALALLAGGVLALRGRFWAGIAAAGIGLGVLVLIATTRMQELGLGRNVQPLAQWIAERGGPDDLVVTTGKFAQDYTLQLTLHRRIGLVGGARELGMGFFAEVTGPEVPIPPRPYDVAAGNLPANRWLFTRERLLAELRGPRRVWFVGAPSQVEDLHKDLPSLRTVAQAGEGVLCTNSD